MAWPQALDIFVCAPHTANLSPLPLPMRFTPISRAQKIYVRRPSIRFLSRAPKTIATSALCSVSSARAALFGSQARWVVAISEAAARPWQPLSKPNLRRRPPSRREGARQVRFARAQSVPLFATSDASNQKSAKARASSVPSAPPTDALLSTYLVFARGIAKGNASRKLEARKDKPQNMLPARAGIHAASPSSIRRGV